MRNENINKMYFYNIMIYKIICLISIKGLKNVIYIYTHTQFIINENNNKYLFIFQLKD